MLLILCRVSSQIKGRGEVDERRKAREKGKIYDN
jgi:hypothetical protein